MEGFLMFVGIIGSAMAGLAALDLAILRWGADSRPLERDARGWWNGGN